MQDDPMRRKRLRLLASQRGMLEVELALRPLVRDQLMQIDAALLDELELLLAMEDLDLWEVLCGKRPLPEGVGPGLLAKVRSGWPGRPPEGQA